ncbi:MAG: integrase core domain-containing protein [Actinobacteria bacterium]|nr:integrase core domain-containing protein [Actinomycetota bacterium]
MSDIVAPAATFPMPASDGFSSVPVKLSDMDTAKKHFLGSITWLGIRDDAAYIGEPETNGCAERFIRTLKEQCQWAELHDTVDQLRQAVTDWTELYNTQWLIGRHGHQAPREAFASAATGVAA